MSTHKVYEWKRLVPVPLPDDGKIHLPKLTWEYTVTSSPDVPPDDSGDWQRVYSVGISAVDGAGGSPARPVRKRDGDN